MQISPSAGMVDAIRKVKSAETILVVCALIPLLYLWMSGRLIVTSTYFHNIGYYSFFGLGYLEIGATAILMYFIVKLVLIPVRMLYAYYYGGTYAPPAYTVYLRSFLLFFHFSTLALCVTLLIDQICRLSPAKIAWASSMVNSWDRVVFGSYVPFMLQELGIPNMVESIAIHSYTCLGLILSSVFIGLLLRNVRLLRKFLLAFFLAPLLSAPIWYAVPAISPGDMYIRNVTAQEIPSELVGGVTLLSARTHTFLSDIEQYKSKPEVGVYADTAFPSMHVAWGMIALWFGMLLWRPFLLVLIPWQLLNMFGAVYTLQHYAIDLPAGIGIAFLSIWVAHRLLGLESRLGINTLEPHAVVSILHTEVEQLLTFVRKHFDVVLPH